MCNSEMWLKIKTKEIVRRLRALGPHGMRQEPMKRSQQLLNIPVTAFSQTDLIWDWIFREWDFRAR